jgi:hypothetical protein
MSASLAGRHHGSRTCDRAVSPLGAEDVVIRRRYIGTKEDVEAIQIRPVAVCTIAVAVCDRALSWSNSTRLGSSPRRLWRIAGFNWSYSKAEYLTQFTVSPCSLNFVRIGPHISRKNVSISFLQDGCCLNFLRTGDDGCFHSMLCLLLSGSQWWTHVSSPVMIRSKIPGSSS